MRFIVPQFIDVEDKIIGPLAVRQFVTILVTAGLIYLEFKLFSFVIFILAALTTAGIGLAFTFVRVNGQPLHYVVLNILQTMQKPNLRSWHKNSDFWTTPEKIAPHKDTYTYVPKVRVSTSRLRELALMVDTGGMISAEQHPYAK